VSYLDLTLLAIISINTGLGFLAGFAGGVLRMASTVVAFAAWIALGTWLMKTLEGPWQPIVALIFAGMVATTVTSMVAGRLTAGIGAWLGDRPTLAWLNRLFGILPGAAWGVLVAYGVAWLASHVISPAGSPLATKLLAAGKGPSEALLAAVPANLPGVVVGPTGIVVFPEAGAKVTAPPDKLEREMLDLVNAERKKAKLAPLVWSDALAAVGRAHSRDMLARNYFAHEDPQGKTVADRAAKAGVRYLTLGENLAFAPTLAIAHQGLMNSPGHRANILRPAFGHVGIGIIRLPAGARYSPKTPGQPAPVVGRVLPGSLLVTQVFRN
jgi:uncharacterized protein YkwD/uncharacterized membrane protein required for colicin V production